MTEYFHGWQIYGPRPTGDAALPWRAWATTGRVWLMAESDRPVDREHGGGARELIEAMIERRLRR